MEADNTIYLFYFYFVLGITTGILGLYVFFKVKITYQRVSGIITGISGIIFALISLFLISRMGG